jgi:tight adherence protein B
MSPLLLIGIAAFVGVAALVGGIALTFHERSGNRLEDRLDLFTGSNTPNAAREGLMKSKSVLSEPLEDRKGLFDAAFAHFGDINRLFEQADTNLTLSRLLFFCAMMSVGGMLVGIVLRASIAFIPLLGILGAGLPFLWLLWRRKKRLKAFAAQLPDALEMLARSLRSGQSLAAGMNMVATEMNAPLNKEFGRVFEEQNLGISLDESLDALTERVPNLDLKFFATAVILQRQTGGDLAEILDKIGGLIRERFQIWGQIQALTGEGRLSGVVLMALPVLLFFAEYYLNPEYVMVLFTDPTGKKMLALGVIMQFIGALVIRKIVNIKV